jgi:transposase
MSRKAYPTDLSDTEWQILEPLIPSEKPGGQHRKVDMRSYYQRYVLLITQWL